MTDVAGVAAQQRPGRLLEQDLGLPAVGHMRRRDLPQPLGAEVDHLAILERSGRPVAEVVQRDHAPERPVGDLAVRGGGQPHVHGAALVGLHVSEADPPQGLDGQHAGHGLGHQGERPAGRCGRQRLLGAIRNWLKVNLGLTAGTKVEIR